MGFYDRDPEDDAVRTVSITATRPGVRLIGPTRYYFRSPEDKRQSALRAAFISPDSPSEAVRGHVFPLRPGKGGKWETLVAISFPMAAEGTQGDKLEREFGGVLSRGPKICHRFDRRITLSRPVGNTAPRVTFLEPVRLAPGSHTLAVVLSDPTSAQTRRAQLAFEVPELPRGLAVVGPILGRRAGAGVVLTGGTGDDQVGGPNSFEPLLVQQIDGPEELIALTQVCLVGSTNPYRGGAAPMVHRTLNRKGGETVGALPDVELAVPDGGKVRCQNLVDVLPAASMAPGEYVFRALVAAIGDHPGAMRDVAFAVGAAPGAPTATTTDGVTELQAGR